MVLTSYFHQVLLEPSHKWIIFGAIYSALLFPILLVGWGIIETPSLALPAQRDTTVPLVTIHPIYFDSRPEFYTGEMLDSVKDQRQTTTKSFRNYEQGPSSNG
jgi:hypothetical protein